MKTDIEIAQSITPHHIYEIAAKLGISGDSLEVYGKYKAKLPLSVINPERIRQSKLVLVSATSPTPAGEGKTTTSIGLNEALNRLGKKSVVVLREPSLGPVFGMKGGATGGGYSQVVPMEDINLHFTGDFSAIEKAHNLLAALIDNTLQNKQPLVQLDPRTVTWKRVMDVNDRVLRKTIIGLGGTANGIPRESGFDITVASEIMAILCLSRSRSELKERLGNILIGFTPEKKPVYARNIKAHGAMTALLKDAILPNLVQTLEGNPAIIHGGPFANIAQGTNTLLATRAGLSLAEITVTEAGFGFDLGAEKFLHIKCRAGDISPQAVVLVTTVRALKYHGGHSLKSITDPNPESVSKGLPNLEKHLENVVQFNLTPVVAINAFPSDTAEETAVILRRCQELGVRAAVSTVFANGGAGGVELAKQVLEVITAEQPSFKPLYELTWPVIQKIETIATKVYGASGVNFQPKALSDLKIINRLQLEHLPICIAKTQKSFSDDPNLLGRPAGFLLNIREIEIASGAGFLIPIAGDIMRMPGLPATPAAENIDIDDNGIISGLF